MKATFHANRTRGTKAEFKNANQMTLLNEAGYPDFNPRMDVKTVDAKAGKIEISGMRIELEPVPNDQDWALQLVMRSLVRFSRDKNRWADSDSHMFLPLISEGINCKIVSVEFRKVFDEGIIRATYNRPSAHLNLSLPPRPRWRDCGLDWLSRDTCCDRERRNPTPWLGRNCGCFQS